MKRHSRKNGFRHGISSLIGTVLMIVIMVNILYAYNRYVDREMETYLSYLDTKYRSIESASIVAKYNGVDAIIVSNPTKNDYRVIGIVYSNGEVISIDVSLPAGETIVINSNSTSVPIYILIDTGDFVDVGGNSQDPVNSNEALCKQIFGNTVTYTVVQKIVPSDSMIIFNGLTVMEDINIYTQFNNNIIEVVDRSRYNYLNVKPIYNESLFGLYNLTSGYVYYFNASSLAYVYSVNDSISFTFDIYYTNNLPSSYIYLNPMYNETGMILLDDEIAQINATYNITTSATYFLISYQNGTTIKTIRTGFSPTKIQVIANYDGTGSATYNLIFGDDNGNTYNVSLHVDDVYKGIIIKPLSSSVNPVMLNKVTGVLTLNPTGYVRLENMSEMQVIIEDPWRAASYVFVSSLHNLYNDYFTLYYEKDNEDVFIVSYDVAFVEYSTKGVGGFIRNGTDNLLLFYRNTSLNFGSYALITYISYDRNNIWYKVVSLSTSSNLNSLIYEYRVNFAEYKLFNKNPVIEVNIYDEHSGTTTRYSNVVEWYPFEASLYFSSYGFIIAYMGYSDETLPYYRIYNPYEKSMIIQRYNVNMSITLKLFNVTIDNATICVYDKMVLYNISLRTSQPIFFETVLPSNYMPVSCMGCTLRKVSANTITVEAQTNLVSVLFSRKSG